MIVSVGLLVPLFLIVSLCSPVSLVQHVGPCPRPITAWIEFFFAISVSVWSIVELVKSFLWQLVGQQSGHTPLGRYGSDHIFSKSRDGIHRTLLIFVAFQVVAPNMFNPRFNSPSCLCNEDYGLTQ